MATNITQAQAFCIATACLQVPVFAKASYPLSNLATNSLNERQFSNKLSLFQPSLLFNGLNKLNTWPNLYNNNQQLEQQRDHPLPSQHRQSSFFLPMIVNRNKWSQTNGMVGSGWFKDLIAKKGASNHRGMLEDPSMEQEIFYVSEYNTDSNKTNAIEQPTTMPTKEPTTSTVAPVTVNSKIEPTKQTEETTTTQKPAKLPQPATPSPSSTQKPSLAETGKTTFSYQPNSNRFYYKEQQTRPLLFPALTLPFTYPFTALKVHNVLDKSNDHQQQAQLHWAAGQVANLMRTVSNNLTRKKLDLVNIWQNLSA